MSSTPVRFALPLVGLFLGVGCGSDSTPEVVEIVRAEGVDPEVVELVAEHVRRAREAPRDGERRARLAMVYEANELWDEARRSWEDALALAADEPLWRYHDAICTRQAGDSERAQVLLREVVSARPGLAAARYRLGDTLLEDGDLAGARAELEAAVQLEPEQPTPYVGLAEVLLREEQYERARTLCERALSLAPEYKRAHYSLGLALRGLGRRAEAQEHMNLGLNAKRDFLGDPLEAEIAGYRRSYTVRIQEAVHYEQAGKPQQAIAILEPVVREHPEELAALNNLAAVYLQVGRSPEAFELLERALLIDPTRFSTHANLATGELARGNFDQALVHAEEAVRLSETVGHAYFTRARVLLALGRASEAYSDLNKAVELDSTRWLPYAYLGDVAIELRLYEQAVEHFEAALRMKPDHLPAHTRLAWSLEQLGRHQQAIAAYERVRALAPRNPEVARLARELGLAPR